MNELLMQFAGGWIGKVGMIFIAAEILDLVKKQMSGRGVWDDLGDMAHKFGKGGGEFLREALHGHKIEPKLIDLLEKGRDIPDEAIDGIIAGLEKQKTGENKDPGGGR